MLDGGLTSVSGSNLLALAVALPVAGMLLGLPMGRHGGLIQLPLLLGGLLIAVLIAAHVWTDGVLVAEIGGWSAPLGIELRADGLSAVMLVTTALVLLPIGLFARGDFPATRPNGAENRAGVLFWPLMMGVWAGLNGAFLSNDLFNIYVALEVLTLSAVPLVTLEGKAATLSAGLRYLLFALLGSLMYMLGAALLFGAHGTLDLTLLSALVHDEPLARVAAALMTAGLLAKTALFPLHLWLPPAHAGAPAPASAILSALVVKGSFYLVVRLWFDLFPELLDVGGARLLGMLGAAAIVVGSVLAVRQERLKLLIAYSTLAQLGYLFLMFPLAGGETEAQPWTAGAWSGGIFHAVSHAFAKASLFLGAGLFVQGIGHDRLEGLRGIGRTLPMLVMAFGLSGLSLMGLPPSGGFIAKWLLLTTAMASGRWVWAMVMLAGGLLAATYTFKVLNRAMAVPERPVQLVRPVHKSRQLLVLLLAVASVLLGLLPAAPFDLLQVGRGVATVEGFE